MRRLRVIAAVLAACLVPAAAAHAATPPDTVIVSTPVVDPYVGSGPGISFATPDNSPVPSFQCQVDGGAWSDCYGTFYPSIQAGAHEVAVRAVGYDGSVDPTPATYDFTSVDCCTYPISVNTALRNLTNQASVRIPFTAPTDATCALDGEEPAPCSPPFTRSGLGDGRHRLLISSEQAGVTSTVTWTVDTTPPDTSFARTPRDGDSDTWAMFASTDPSGSFACSLDGAPFQPCGPTYVVEAPAAGRHTLAVSAVDAAGNVDPTPATTSWIAAVPAVKPGPTAHARAVTPSTPAALAASLALTLRETGARNLADLDRMPLSYAGGAASVSVKKGATRLLSGHGTSRLTLHVTRAGKHLKRATALKVTVTAGSQTATVPIRVPRGS